MNIEQLRKLGAMKYWSLPAGSSEKQKKKFEDEIRGKNYIALKKRDGAWYRFSQTTKDDQMLQSRTISVKTKEPVEKQDNVPHIMEALSVLPENTVLLGEICYKNTSMTSPDVVSIMGCLPKKAVERQSVVKLHYYIFDVLFFAGEEIGCKSAEVRLELLKNIKENFVFPEFIEFAEPVYENIPNTIANWLADGDEGAVLLHKKKPYSYERVKSAEAWTTMKVKQSVTDGIDLVIMSFTPSEKAYTGEYPQIWIYWENMRTGQLVEDKMWGKPGFTPVTEGYFKGQVGSMVLGAYYNDTLVQVGKVNNLTDAIRQDATDNPEKYIGRVVEVNAMSIDKERKSLRHAKLVRFRDDKVATECNYKDIF